MTANHGINHVDFFFFLPELPMDPPASSARAFQNKTSPDSQHPSPFSHQSWSGLGADAVDITLRVKLVRQGKTAMFHEYE